MRYRYFVMSLVMGFSLQLSPVLAEQVPAGGAGQNQGTQQQSTTTQPQQPQQQNAGQSSPDMRKPEGDMHKDLQNPRNDMGHDMMGDKAGGFEGQKNMSFGGDQSGNKQMMNNQGKQMQRNPFQGQQQFGDQKNMMFQHQNQQRFGARRQGGDQQEMKGIQSQDGQGDTMDGQQQQGASDEQMQERQKKMDDQRFTTMKQGLGQFQQGLQRMKTEVARREKSLQKCGVGIPDELKTALSNGEAVIPKIQAAQNIDDLEAVMGDIQDSGDAMREWGPKMGEFQRLCEMLKRADQDVNRVKKDVDRLEKRVTSQKKFDLSELLTDVKDRVTKLQSALADAKTKGKTDPDDALGVLQDDVFGQMSEVSIAEQGIEMTLNVTKGLKDADREIKKYESLVKRLKNQKKDTSELEGLIADLKAKQKEVTDLLSQKKFDPDDLVSLIQEASDVRGEVVNALEGFGVLQDFMPQFKQEQGVNIQVPQAFGSQQFQGQQMDQQQPNMMQPQQQPQGGGFNMNDIQSFFDQSKNKTVASL